MRINIEKDLYISIKKIYPRYMLDMKEVSVGDCYSICGYRGVTYIGEHGKVHSCRFVEQRHQLESFLTVNGTVEGLCANKERLYILVNQPPYMVYVSDLEGTIVTRWQHSETFTNLSSTITVTGDRVILPDRSRRQLTIYTSEGSLVKHIACEHLEEQGSVSSCTPEEGSVVVACSTPSVVFRVNIDTEEVIWSFNDANGFGGVTNFGRDYIITCPAMCKGFRASIFEADSGW